MKKITLTYLALFMMFSCSLQKADINNIDITLYENIINGFPYCGVFDKTSNSLLILGRKVSSNDNDAESCSLVKFSNNGEVLKELLIGSKTKRLNKIYITPTDRIFLSGYSTIDYKYHTWVVEIDRDLKIISETIFKHVGDDYPNLTFLKNEVVSVENSREQIVIRKYNYKFEQKSLKIIEHPFRENGAHYRNSLTYLTKQNNLIITGNASPFTNEKDEFYNYDIYVYCLNLDKNEIVWSKFIGNNSKYLTADCITEKDESIYIGGVERNNDNDRLDIFNVVLYEFSKSGELKNEIIDTTSIYDYTNSIGFFNNNILITGRSMIKIKIEYKGKVRDGGKYICMSKKLKNYSLSDIDLCSNYLQIEQIKFIGNLDKDKLLILGTNDGNKNWRIIVTNANNGNRCTRDFKKGHNQ